MALLTRYGLVAEVSDAASEDAKSAEVRKRDVFCIFMSATLT
jgi:hypothetical protein